MTSANIVLVLAALATALMAGLFYSWSCSVTIGIARLSDREYLAAMQSMNSAILNPFFFAAFFGALILLPVSTWMHYGQRTSLRFWLLLAATLCYVFGVFGVTVAGNVPLNETLATFDLNAAAANEISAHRTNFEGPWNKLNLIRSAFATVSIVLVIIACMSHED
jgi:uncharacterized membrane protein